MFLLTNKNTSVGITTYLLGKMLMNYYYLVNKTMNNWKQIEKM